MLPAFSKYIAICVPYLRNPFCRAGFTGRASQKPPPQGRFQGRGLAAFMPWQQETGTCLIFIRRPIHMPKKQTPPGSGQKGRPPWQAAVRRRFRSWLLGWGVFHEEEGGVCPFLVSIEQ